MKTGHIIVAGIMILMIGMYAVGSLSKEWAIVLGGVAVVAFFWTGDQKQIISLTEGTRILKTELVKLQSDGELENGNIEFEKEADPTFNQNGEVISYEIMFSVTNPSGTNYYMGRVGAYGSFMGITKKNMSESILTTNRSMNIQKIDAGTPMKRKVKEEERDEP